MDKQKKQISEQNCADCIHYEACAVSDACMAFAPLGNPETICKHFADKSLYIKLPCKVGDTVWINGCFGGLAEPHKIVQISTRTGSERSVYSFEAWLVGKYPISRNNSASFWDDAFGKTVFLTREEAEAALEGRE